MNEPLIDKDLAEKVLSGITAGDFAEIFVEDKNSVSGLLDDDKIEEFSSGRRKGAGIRVLSGDSVGFAHTSDLSEQGLLKAAASASAAARSSSSRNGRDGRDGGQIELSEVAAQAPNEVRVAPDSVSKDKKAELLFLANDSARSQGSEITQVACRYGDTRRRILVANTDGVFATDDQTKTFFSVACVAFGDSGMQTGRESLGRTIGFELFEEYEVADIARTAADRALLKLKALPAPSGAMPVVVGPGGGGVLFHEACGHGLEADLIAKSASVFGGRIGEQVASPLVTLVDDGTMAEEWGCYAIDDEGRPAQKNVLIKDGILQDYMWDQIRARKEGRPSSGNGRRESYEHLPMVRMTNTYIEGGDTNPQDIIADTDSGIYVSQLGGGQVNTATGDFVFGMTEAYLIKNGKLAEPIREGNLIGNGPDILNKIDVLGNDFALGAPGTCGKDGQGVPVGDGTPTLRVTSLTVGGTSA